MSKIFFKIIKIPYFKNILAKIFLINTKIFWRYVSNANKEYKFRFYKPDELIFSFFKLERKVKTIIEFGSGYGDLLFNIYQCDISKLIGYELNSSKVDLGNSLFKQKGINKIELICRDITKIKKQDIGGVDFFITSMTLIYLKEIELKNVLKLITEHCQKGFVLQEFSSENKELKNKTFYIHNFKKIFKEMKLENKFKIKFKHIDYEYWNNKDAEAFQIEAKIK